MKSLRKINRLRKNKIPKIFRPTQNKFKSVEDVFLTAATEFGGEESPLVFTKKAHKTALKSPYRQTMKLFGAITVLYRYSLNWAESDQNTGTNTKTYFGSYSETSGCYRPGVSQTAMGKHTANYVSVYDGKSIASEEHLTLGSGNPSSCCSIHFWRDKANSKLIITHCGRHKPNTNS